MVNCKECDNLIEEIIKVVDVVYANPFMDDIYHFEEGYRCTWNGVESLRIEDLSKGSCRCRGDGL